MNRIALVVILSAASFTQGQTVQFEIKGHKIGESVADFLKAEPAVQAATANCPGHDPLSADIDRADCKTLLRIFSGKNDPDTQDKWDFYGGNGFGSHGNVDWLFDSGRLVGVALEPLDADYATVRRDVIKRMSGMRPSRESSVPYHNGFGATWRNNTATWKTPTLYVQLDEVNNPAEPSLGLIVRTRASHDAEVRARPSHRSPLDK